MTRDMLAIGRPRPEIYEIAGPYVRVALLGGEPDPEVVQLIADIEPASNGSATICGPSSSATSRISPVPGARKIYPNC